MTQYTCKRLCCAVTFVPSTRRGLHNLIKLNGVVSSAVEIAAIADVSIQSIHRRIRGGRCLQIHREDGDRKLMSRHLIKKPVECGVQALMATWKPRGEA